MFAPDHGSQQNAIGQTVGAQVAAALAPRATVAVIGSLGFWCDGSRFVCRLLTPFADPSVGFEFCVRQGAL